MSEVCIVGGSIAGLSAALMLARRGHRVTVLERDDRPMPVDPLEAGRWLRPTVPQTQQSHAIPAAGRRVLQRRLPDVLDRLIAAGAREFAFADSLPAGALRHVDPALAEDLVVIGCRRGVIDLVLRQAAAAEPGIALLTGAVVEDVVWADGPVPTARAVRTRGHDTFPAELIVDASGRRTDAGAWLRSAGVSAPTEDYDIEAVAHTRFYRVNDVAGAPRTEFGHMTSATFEGALGFVFAVDHDVVGVSVARHPRDGRRAEIRDPRVFERLIRSASELAPFVDPAATTPISPVHVMAGLRATLRRMRPEGRLLVAGFVPIGDALVAVNPIFGRGMGLALLHAEALASAPPHRPGLAAVGAVEIQRRLDEISEPVWADCRAHDLTRIHAWRRALGLPQPADPEPAGRLSVRQAMPLLRRDAEVYLRYWRATQLLDPPADFFTDPSLIERAAALESGRAAIAS